MHRWGLFLILFLVGLFPGELPGKTIPDVLKPWHDWVLWDNDMVDCPLVAGFQNQQLCTWPSALSLTVTDSRISFSQQWELFSESWVPLPGDSKLWPGRVTVNSTEGVLVDRKGKPFLRLGAGTYKIEGIIFIEKVPPKIDIPPYTGLVDLTLGGKQISQPTIDDNGRLLLVQQKPKSAKAENSLSVQVFRQMRDGYPIMLETRIVIDVSGEERLQTMGRLIPRGFEMTAIRSSLPVRITPAGDLQVQLQPGHWQLTFLARYPADDAVFNMEQRENWPAQELWSFVHNRQFRLVDVQGSAHC